MHLQNEMRYFKTDYSTEFSTLNLDKSTHSKIRWRKMFKFVDYCYLTNALCEQVCKGQKVDTHETFCANTENDTTKYVNMDALFKKKR